MYRSIIFLKKQLFLFCKMIKKQINYCLQQTLSITVNSAINVLCNTFETLVSRFNLNEIN